MEVSSKVFVNILSPLAVVAQTRSSWEASETETEEVETTQTTGLSSPSQNGMSLVGKAPQTWKVDGIDANGERFFAIPTFAADTPPLRVDVHIPPRETWPRAVRELLDPDASIYRVGNMVAASPISQYLVEGLGKWSAEIPGFEQLYSNLPLGSQVQVSRLGLRTEDMEIDVIQSYDTEQAMCSIEALQQMWNQQVLSWPPVIEWEELQYQRQMHEAITLVKLPARLQDQTLVFKSLTQDQHHLYNELKFLLTLDSHPNVINKPLYIVTRKCRFGGKRGVCGFILEYYPLGSLHGRLLDSANGVQPLPTLAQCYKWSRQVTKALIHINNMPSGFYPDLKPDNIVFREDNAGSLDAVLLDFEQRGGWYSWSPPEVLYIEYMEMLATQAEDPELCSEITEHLRGYVSNWTPAMAGRKYTDTNGGYSTAWLALRRFTDESGQCKALDQAQVFLLGKLLWCIFESQPFVRCGIDHDVLRDPDPGPVVFPKFQRTPEVIQQLIRDCTCGAPEWEGRRRGIILRGGKLVPTSVTDLEERDIRPEHVCDAAKNWWATEVGNARVFLNEVSRSTTKDNTQRVSKVLKQAGCRPLLHEVLSRLDLAEAMLVRGLN